MKPLAILVSVLAVVVLWIVPGLFYLLTAVQSVAPAAANPSLVMGLLLLMHAIPQSH
jgi:hypothetical protein